MPDDNYTVDVRCNNCNLVHSLTVEKGTLVDDKVITEICPKCGLKGSFSLKY